MENNMVSVKIYGQEYKISGDKSREHILRVADYVDSNMHEMAELIPNAPVSALAILTSINTADEYFENMARLESQEKLCTQKEKDIEHYIQLWNEAKKSFTQFKEDTEVLIKQKEDLKNTLAEKDERIEDLEHLLDDMEKRAIAGDEEKLKAAEERERELESSFFDLQMENIRLKSELDRIKKNQNELNGKL